MLYIGFNCVLKNLSIISILSVPKLSLENLIDMLQTDSKTPTPEMLSLITEFKELDTLFDKVKINSTEIESIVNTKNKITTLAVKSEMKFKKEDFEKIITKVEKMRANIVG